MRLRPGNSWGEDVGCEGSSRVVTGRCFLNAISNNKRAGCQIAQPLMILRDKDRDGSYRKEERNLNHVADEIPGHRLEQSDRPAGPLDNADARHSLTVRSANPESLKEGEIPPV